MNKPLATYLHDHLAGSNFAVDLLKALEERYQREQLASFASALRIEFEEDQSVLRGLAERTGDAGSAVKEAASWIAEKASRFKLAWSVNRDLGALESLEALSLGVTGKLELWRALMVIAPRDPRLAGVDFHELADRAEDQLKRIEHRRLEAAKAALVEA